MYLLTYVIGMFAISLIIYYLFSISPIASLIISTFSLSTGVELLEDIMPAGIALALLAVMEMLPETGVEASLTMSSVSNVMYLKYISSNFTGANRMIIGAGLPIIFFLFYIGKQKNSELKFKDSLLVPLFFLFISTIVFGVSVITSSFSVYLAIAMIAIFIMYIYTSYYNKNMKRKEEEYTSVTGKIRSNVTKKHTILLTSIFLIAIGTVLLYYSIDPFIKQLLEFSIVLGIPSYFFIQWVAPFATEFPELSTFFLWSRNKAYDSSISALASSLIMEWTVMMSVVPILYLLFSPAHYTYIPLDYLQKMEIIITMEQSILFALITFKLNVKKWEAISIFLLWVMQIPLIFIGSTQYFIVLISLYSLLIFIEIFYNYKILKENYMKTIRWIKEINF
ncbi:MAG: hypothetical protein ACP5RS_01940 [Thermoplasmata archaeon]